MQVIIGSDHAGYEYKTRIIQWLEREGYRVEDVGAHSEESCDYPRYAHRVGEELERAPTARGILICGSGIGMSMAANRHHGVRAALCMNASMARMTREHNDANCLVLGQRIMEAERALETVETFLETEFHGGRHARRVGQIDEPPLQVVQHPLVRSKLTRLRDQRTSSDEVRSLIGDLAQLLFLEAAEGSSVTTRSVETPLTSSEGWQLEHPILLVPILRAGLGMLDPLLEWVPEARVGHLGLNRDEETLDAEVYYQNLPVSLQSDDPRVYVLDPMLATGGTAVQALDVLKQAGFERDLVFLSIVASTEGLGRVQEHHPDVRLLTASIDDHLDDEGFIVPGIGDAGDRQYGTERG